MPFAAAGRGWHGRPRTPRPRELGHHCIHLHEEQSSYTNGNQLHIIKISDIPVLRTISALGAAQDNGLRDVSHMLGSRADDARRKGLDPYSRGEYGMTAREYDRAIRLGLDGAVAHVDNGEALFSLGDY